MQAKAWAFVSCAAWAGGATGLIVYLGVSLIALLFIIPIGWWLINVVFHSVCHTYGIEYSGFEFGDGGDSGSGDGGCGGGCGGCGD